MAAHPCAAGNADLISVSLLEDFRGFRHVFRHSYSFELDWERERLVARKLRRASALLREQVDAFLMRLDEIET